MAARTAWIPALLALLVLPVACRAPDRTNSVWRAAAERERHELQGEREWLRRERVRLLAAIGEDEAMVGRLRDQAAAAAASLRDALRRLDAELQAMQHAEEDLLAARTRATAVAAELLPLRQAEAELATLQARLQAVAGERAGLQEQVQVAEAELAAAQAVAMQRLREVQELSDKVRGVETAAAAALELVRAALLGVGAGGAGGGENKPAEPPAEPPVPKPAEQPGGKGS